MDTIHGDNIFVQSFSYPSHQKRTPLPDFREFVADKILENVVNETNITSFKKWQIHEDKYGRSIIFYWYESDSEDCKITIL